MTDKYCQLTTPLFPYLSMSNIPEMYYFSVRERVHRALAESCLILGTGFTTIPK